jgi:endonuclease YncB( thermonuclease family)
VIDGDTIEVLTEKKERIEVRLVRIDTPERG